MTSRHWRGPRSWQGVVSRNNLGARGSLQSLSLTLTIGAQGFAKHNAVAGMSGAHKPIPSIVLLGRYSQR